MKNNSYNMQFEKFIFVVIFAIISINLFAEKTITVFSPKGSPMLDFALTDLSDELASKGMEISKSDFSGANILLLTQSEFLKLKSKGNKYPEINFDLKPEGFCIRKDKDKIWVVGADEPGLMYGVFELTEQIKVVGLDKIEETNQNPYMPTRGVKFNLPLDIRTPTYTDPCLAAQENLENMWSMDFWTGYIDHLARHRYNMISLWNLHPFPSMVKVPDYPDAALNDVWDTNKKIQGFHEVGNGQKYDELLKDTRVVLQMTMDEKITHWRRVMQYAKSRNVNFFLMTWNIFDWGVEGKYGITESVDNEVTKDYYRKSVKQMLLTYPELAGIGLTVGENMADIPLQKKENWAFDTYGKGVLDVLKLQPERKLIFIHRLHQGDVPTITSTFKELIDQKNIDFVFSFKYAQAHVMSSTNQPYCNPIIKEIEPAGYKTLWTLRNDDNFYFRWGAPDFVREFFKNIPYKVSQGYYYGSDGYIWGREFLAKEPGNPRTLEVDKHWYHFMLFGRLGYNPEMTNERFVQIIQHRFPQVDARQLFDAWQNASMIYPVTTGFHWGAADFSWYIEGSTSHLAGTPDRTGIHNVEQFIRQGVHGGTNNQTIPEYVKMIENRGTTSKTTPLQVAEQLHNHSEKALALLQKMNANGNQELAKTLADVKSISYLGKHYAHKISGSTYQALYNNTKDKKYQQKTIVELEAALKYWSMYAENASLQYINPVWMKRVGWADWEKFKEIIKKDIEIAKQGIKE